MRSRGTFLLRLGDNRRSRVEPRIDASMSDQPRPDAATNKHSYLLSVAKAVDRYAAPVAPFAASHASCTEKSP
jgi:hypothetical protein